MRNIVTFHRLASAAVEKTAAGNSEGQKITYNVIKQRLGDVLYKLTAQKFEDPGACRRQEAGWGGSSFAPLLCSLVSLIPHPSCALVSLILHPCCRL